MRLHKIHPTSTLDAKGGHMDLESYLFRTRQTYASFSRRLGCNSRYLSRVARGLIKPGKILAKLIMAETAGVVRMGEDE